MKHSFPELQSHGSVDCPILHAIKNRFPVGITILGQTYRVINQTLKFEPL